MSSTTKQSLFLISPIIFITSETFALSLLLSTIARLALILLAMFLALTTPPTSGEITTISLFLYFSFISFVIIGAAYKLSTGISKKP